MKKFYLSFVFISIILLLFSKPTQGTHFTGGEITYVCIGGNYYLITFTLYRDCSGIWASGEADIKFTSSCDTFQLTFPQVITPIFIPTSCPSQPSVCQNSSSALYGVQLFVYQKTVYLKPCSDWVISNQSCCRNPSNTLSNPTGYGYYIPATLNNLAAPCNSSPQFTNFPVVVGCTGQPYIYNHGSIDPDGDSLVYKLVAPMKSDTAPVNYMAGYSASYPMPSNPPLSVNPLTGTLSANPSINFITALAVKVEEWRRISGIPVMIGSVIRDIQINFYGSCNNTYPTLAGINPSATQYSASDTNYIIGLYYGDTIDFNVYANDVDLPAQNLTMTFYGDSASGVFTVTGNGTPNPVGHFHWEPGMGSYGFPKCFTVNIQDDACPYVGQQTILYCIMDTTTFGVGIQEYESLSFDIFPNPANDNLTITYASNIEDDVFAGIYSVEGKLMQSIPIIQKKTEINIAALHKGIYFIKIESSQGMGVKKMIKP